MRALECLLLISGPSAAGKTTLLNRWWSDAVSSLRSHLQVHSKDQWSSAEAQQIPQYGGEFPRRLLLHFDFHAQHSGARQFRYLADLVERSDTVQVLTLCASAEALIERIDSRLQQLIESLPALQQAGGSLQRYCEILRGTRQAYSQKGFLSDLYHEWIACIEELRVDQHWLLDSNSPELPAPIELINDLLEPVAVRLMPPFPVIGLPRRKAA